MHQYNNKGVKRFYDGLYVRRRDQSNLGWVYRNLVEVQGLVKAFKGRKLILDAGCGIGRISIPLSQSGANVIGIDVSGAAVRVALSMSEEACTLDRTEFLVADINFLPFHDLVFDGVFFLGTLETCSDITAPLQEALRVMKPLGLGYLNVYNALTKKIVRVLNQLMYAKTRDLPSPRTFSLKSLHNLAPRMFLENRFSGHFFILPIVVSALSKASQKLLGRQTIAIAIWAWRVNNYVTPTRFGKYISPDIGWLFVKSSS